MLISTKLKLEKIFIRKLFFWIVRINAEVDITGIREKKPGKIELSLKIKNEINITIIENIGINLKNNVKFS